MHYSSVRWFFFVACTLATSAATLVMGYQYGRRGSVEESVSRPVTKAIYLTPDEVRFIEDLKSERALIWHGDFLNAGWEPGEFREGRFQVLEGKARQCSQWLSPKATEKARSWVKSGNLQLVLEVMADSQIAKVSMAADDWENSHTCMHCVARKYAGKMVSRKTLALLQQEMHQALEIEFGD